MLQALRFELISHLMSVFVFFVFPVYRQARDCQYQHVQVRSGRQGSFHPYSPGSVSGGQGLLGRPQTSCQRRPLRGFTYAHPNYVEELDL